MPANFTHVGRVVTHTAAPHFSVTFQPNQDGGWDGTDIKFSPDTPLPSAQTLARLMREVGDYFAAAERRDWVQDRVIARAQELGLTAYALSQATGGAVSPEHVKNYLERRASMGSHKLQHVLRALRLDVAPIPYE